MLLEDIRRSKVKTEGQILHHAARRCLPRVRLTETEGGVLVAGVGGRVRAVVVSCAECQLCRIKRAPEEDGCGGYRAV